MTARSEPTRELVVCSLEAWDEVWRRNQFLVDGLLRRFPALRVLFVEPPVDVPFELANGRRPARTGLRSLRTDGRLHALRPLKPLPRRLGPLADRVLHQLLLGSARRLRLSSPTLWVNDVTYAPLIRRTGWPSVYDVTDDWLLAPAPRRELERIRALDALALSQADEVVVCSATLAASRGATRAVTLIPNGVDVERFRRPHPRPADLPPSPSAVYVGTLHESRLDVDLLVETATHLPALSVALVGPDALSEPSRRRLRAQPQVQILGPRRHEEVPAYLQHANVIVVPHRVTPFTDSLDPIKAYECAAVATPTVATPVAGFRELEAHVRVADRRDFASAVAAVLAAGPVARSLQADGVANWGRRAESFEAALASARSSTRRRPERPETRAGAEPSRTVAS